MNTIFKPEGVHQFLGIYIDNLITRKTVALFDNYEDSKNDIIFEMVSKKITGKAEIKDLNNLLDKMEEFIDFESFFNEI